MVSDFCVSEIVTGCNFYQKKDDWEFSNSIIVNFDHNETCAACYVFLMVGSLCIALDCGCWIICRFVEPNTAWKLKFFNT